MELMSLFPDSSQFMTGSVGTVLTALGDLISALIDKVKGVVKSLFSADAQNHPAQEKVPTPEPVASHISSMQLKSCLVGQTFVPLEQVLSLPVEMKGILREQGVEEITPSPVNGGGYGTIYFGKGKGIKPLAIKLISGKNEVLPGTGEVNGLGLPKKRGLQRTKGLIILDSSKGSYHYISKEDQLSQYDSSKVTVQGTISRLREHGDLFDLNEQGILTPKEKKEIAWELAKAILAFHKAKPNTVHNDIKPDNIFIKWVNGKPTVKLADVGESIPIGDKGGGTLGYSAPFDWERKQESDWYSYGKTLYALFTGLMGRIDYNTPALKEDPELSDFISQFMQLSTRRLAGDAVLNHPYFKEMRGN